MAEHRRSCIFDDSDDCVVVNGEHNSEIITRIIFILQDYIDQT
jgi:hypothetical protein